MLPFPKSQIEFGGDSLNSASDGSYDIYNRFEIFDNNGNPIGGAITGGYFDGPNAYVLDLSDGVLSSYGGQNLEFIILTIQLEMMLGCS